MPKYTLQWCSPKISSWSQVSLLFAQLVDTEPTLYIMFMPSKLSNWLRPADFQLIQKSRQQFNPHHLSLAQFCVAQALSSTIAQKPSILCCPAVGRGRFHSVLSILWVWVWIFHHRIQNHSLPFPIYGKSYPILWNEYATIISAGQTDTIITGLWQSLKHFIPTKCRSYMGLLNVIYMVQRNSVWWHYTK